MKIAKNFALAMVVATNLTLLTVPLHAETVSIPLGQQGQQSLERPPKGTNKAQVEAVYGKPQSKHGPVGDPPIYSWEYPAYTVYFEGDFVLHTVLKQQTDSDNNQPGNE